MFLHATYFYRHFSLIILATKCDTITIEIYNFKEKLSSGSIISYAVLVERRKNQ